MNKGQFYNLKMRYESAKDVFYRVEREVDGNDFILLSHDNQAKDDMYNLIEEVERLRSIFESIANTDRHETLEDVKNVARNVTNDAKWILNGGDR